jgi:hypothetical protein
MGTGKNQLALAALSKRDEPYQAKELAEMLGTSVQALYGLARSGDLIKVGRGKFVRTVDDLHNSIKRRENRLARRRARNGNGSAPVEGSNSVVLVPTALPTALSAGFFTYEPIIRVGTVVQVTAVWIEANGEINAALVDDAQNATRVVLQGA